MNAASLSPDSPIVRNSDLDSADPPPRGTKIANGTGVLGLYAGCTSGGTHYVAWPHPANDAPGHGLSERFEVLCARLDEVRPSRGFLQDRKRGAWLVRRGAGIPSTYPSWTRATVAMTGKDRSSQTFQELRDAGALVPSPEHDLDPSFELSHRRGTRAYTMPGQWLSLLRNMKISTCVGSAAVQGFDI